MIFSMTGYGRGEAVAEGIYLTAEARTLNNRFFDFSLRSSRSLQNFEPELRELCRSRIERRKLTLTLTETRSESAPSTARLDLVAAQKLADELTHLRESLGLEGGVNLDHLLHFPELLVQVEDPAVGEVLLNLAREATDAALSDLKHAREKEGAMLVVDMKERLSALESALGEVKRIQEDFPAKSLEKLRERVKRLTLPGTYDAYRLEMELAILADRLDISEECVRLQGHITVFGQTLKSPKGASGKRLEFLLQEMNREANTIGSKTASLEISHVSVQIKEEIERLREQVQNIE